LVLQAAAREDGVVLAEALLVGGFEMLQVPGQRTIDCLTLLRGQVSRYAELLPRPMHHHATRSECADRREVDLAAHQAYDLTEAGLGTQLDRERDPRIDVGVFE